MNQFDRGMYRVSRTADEAGRYAIWQYSDDGWQWAEALTGEQLLDWQAGKIARGEDRNYRYYDDASSRARRYNRIVAERNRIVEENRPAWLPPEA
jgi:hypothetical protein